MPLSKSNIITKISNGTAITRKQSYETVETILGIIKSTLASGEDVLINGFGKFCVKEKADRRGRNPATGEEMTLEPRNVVIFKCLGKLRDKVNRG